MHQPYYADPVSQRARMPWVRLHAVHSYLDMIDVLERFPSIKVTFNITPVLIQQIEELAQGKMMDEHELISRTPVEELRDDQKIAILEGFFRANWETMIRPIPRYWELLQRRGKEPPATNHLAESTRLFSLQDYLDLQTLHNLVWCGFAARKRFPLIEELRVQGRDFTEEQRDQLLDIHREILRLILPLYRKAMERGQIEITTSPYFHPILPLIYNSDFAARCMPHVPLPTQFYAPEDALAQLQLAQAKHRATFGKEAQGVWPSEGSVCPELVPLFHQAGFQYFCTDEGILFHSLSLDPRWRSKASERGLLFRGWRVVHQDSEVLAVFRDRGLSDFIGFQAANNEPSQAVNFILHHLEQICSSYPSPSAVVCLALDGENAWENFRDQGEEFLQRLYEGLSLHTRLKTRTLGEYFSLFPPDEELRRLYTGSWIHSDFDIWIGDPEENKAWEWLRRTRAFLCNRAPRDSQEAAATEAAWMELYAAEGSDWFWWYGPDFVTDTKLAFDELFRTHLKNVYLLSGTNPPPYLDVSICAPVPVAAYTKPSAWVTPALSGKLEDFFEWVGAGFFNLRAQGSAMFLSNRIGQGLWFGFDRETFYLRLDLSMRPESVQVDFISPTTRRVTLEIPAGRPPSCRAEQSSDGVHFEPCDIPVKAAWEDFLVVAIPIPWLAWEPGKEVAFFVKLMEKGMVLERYPDHGALSFIAPTEDFEAAQWFV